VYALSADDGTEQWSFQTGNKVRTSPAVVDGTVYVGSLDNNVYALTEQ
jgi:outer membrane protein assembly factor BamB